MSLADLAIDLAQRIGYERRKDGAPVVGKEPPSISTGEGL